MRKYFTQCIEIEDLKENALKTKDYMTIAHTPAKIFLARNLKARKPLWRSIFFFSLSNDYKNDDGKWCVCWCGGYGGGGKCLFYDKNEFISKTYF